MKYTRGSKKKETAAVSNVIMKAAELTSAMRDLWTFSVDIKVGDEKVGAIIGSR